MLSSWDISRMKANWGNQHPNLCLVTYSYFSHNLPYIHLASIGAPAENDASSNRSTTWAKRMETFMVYSGTKPHPNASITREPLRLVAMVGSKRRHGAPSLWVVWNNPRARPWIHGEGSPSNLWLVVFHQPIWKIWTSNYYIFPK